MEKPKSHLKPDELEGVVAVADVPRSDGTVFPADELRAMHDGVRFFWDEASKQLVWRGPRAEVYRGRAYASLKATAPPRRGGLARFTHGPSRSRHPMDERQPNGPCSTVYRRP